MLHLEVPATPAHVGRLRRAVRGWLGRALGDGDADAVDNLTLAVSEALENAAEHAYADRDEPGTMTLSAQRDARKPGAVVISVSDSGHWRAPTEGNSYRGRGLALIEELADAHTVRPGPTGTTVTLRHPG
ncbi:anti-sigma regulatory factor (Ser/Thr protein kinase) [Actinomycetospora succinea]|uniref:Anti-sigma regulatory factor (Ser/Thr protein kinase) n=1 Tax=Actinomycetospora succinea TaxID=663603 RepID=A0A4R6VMY4_9PSEU|nr:ATP-binding protein [Actinomycetospora succinea]TDQ63321.1 anti-sigma regulatory factor (Ser/Thr protein kinase) [Actinomycetospora succinea]